MSSFRGKRLGRVTLLSGEQIAGMVKRATFLRGYGRRNTPHRLCPRISPHGLLSGFRVALNFLIGVIFLIN